MTEKTWRLPAEQFLDILTFMQTYRQEVKVRARGSSMWPFIKDNDVVVLSPCDPGLLRTGDTVAYKTRGTGVAVHRIVSSRSGGILLKGDAGCSPDGWMDRSTVIGRIIAVYRGRRRVRWGLGPERSLIAIISRRYSWAKLLAVPRRMYAFARKAF
ncbi:hypothetical protein GF324_08350 [bacterium]|nr:hypothetical protein [bacterium]